MKLESIGNKLVIYLYNINNLDFKNKKDLEEYFKVLFKKLKEIYNIKISGYYNINVYIDNIYGIIIELEKEQLDYYDYFNNQVDMHILTEDTKFLYLIEDYFPFINLKNIEIYKYKNKIYILPLENTNLIYILENSKLVYKETLDILKYGKKVEIKE